MPFLPPFRKRFIIGDLIYGLSHIRQKYLNIFNFATANIYFSNEMYPPIVIDSYLTPTDERNRIEFMVNYERNVKSGNNINLNNEEKFLNYLHQCEYTKSPKYKIYKDDFFKHLENHEKYKIALENNPDNDDSLIFGRKCKGGLSWITFGNSKLFPDAHIHFLLDGIDLDRIINKRDNYITGKELRWLFRHRHYPKVANKVQFWKNCRPTTPPWTGFGSTEWEKYIYHDTSEAFSRLFNLP
ncbi:MAG: hypothetical protein LBI71_00500 [Enterobacteriaceae bacterium]|jgi:hypothetical protein|nr:hypothetical protein [Enterobacteriaceae bacterium]